MTVVMVSVVVVITMIMIRVAVVVVLVQRITIRLRCWCGYSFCRFHPERSPRGEPHAKEALCSPQRMRRTVEVVASLVELAWAL